MIEIKRLPEFDEWLDGIKDNMTRIRLNRRLDKVEPYRVCRRVNILRDYPDDKIKIYP